MNTKSLLYLWDDRTLFLGRLDEPIFLSQGAATLTVALEKKLLITVIASGFSFESYSVLLSPGCSVHIDSGDQLIANFNLDVMGSDLYFLSQLMEKHDDSVYSGLNDDVFKSAFVSIFKGALKPSDARIVIDKLFSGCVFKTLDFEIDERVLKVLQIIRGRVDKNFPIKFLADSVNLSIPALTRIFKKQTGIPIRRYRQWHRLFVTAVEMSNGSNLTEAALIAGFVDLSHCTHTFNMMLGVRPSYFLSRPEKMKIMVGNSSLLCG